MPLEPKKPHVLQGFCQASVLDWKPPMFQWNASILMFKVQTVTVLVPRTVKETHFYHWIPQWLLMSFSKTWKYVRKDSKDLSLFGKLTAGNQILLVQMGITRIQLRSSTLGKHWVSPSSSKSDFSCIMGLRSLSRFPKVWQPAMLGYAVAYVFQPPNQKTKPKSLEVELFNDKSHHLVKLMMQSSCIAWWWLLTTSLLQPLKESQHLLSIKSFVCGFLLP